MASPGGDADLYEVKTSLAVLKADVSHISRAVDEVRENMRSGLATKADLAAIDARLERVESTQTWVMRTVLGAVIMAVMTFLYLNGGAPK